MARRAAPFNVRCRDGYAFFDARINGTRYRESLGIPYTERPSRAEFERAREAGAKRYAQIIEGRTLAPHQRIKTTHTLSEMFAVFLDAIETPTNKKSVNTKRGHARNLLAWAKNDPESDRWINDSRTPLDRLTCDAGPMDYGMYRLGNVLRKTVRKELVTLFEFLRWAKRKTYLADLPPRPELPKGETGVRVGPQRAKPVHVNAEQMEAIITDLPEWSIGRRSKGEPRDRFRVRAPIELRWETGLRQATIDRLEVPRNYFKGGTHLVLEDADDKARFGRELPLSARAREILDDVSPNAGLIFGGEHDYFVYLKAAAKKVLPPNLAAKFAGTDIRHAKVKNFLDATADMIGVAFLVGHKQLTTTNIYSSPQQAHGERAMAAFEAARAHEDSGTIRAHEEEEEDEDPTNTSGRVDSNHRPPDPQSGSNSDSSGNSKTESRQGTSKNAAPPGELPAFGHDSGTCDYCGVLAPKHVILYHDWAGKRVLQ